jgi:hypothetical protein
MAQGNPRGRAFAHRVYEYRSAAGEHYVGVGVGDGLPSALVAWIAAREAEGVTPERVRGSVPESFLGSFAARWIATRRRAELGLSVDDN